MKKRDTPWMIGSRNAAIDPKSKKSVTISFRITESEKMELESRANEQNKTIAQYVKKELFKI